VSGYHNPEASRFGLQIQLGEVMQDVDGNAGDFDDLGLGQFASQGPFVDVPAYRGHRCDIGECLEDLGCAYVAGVNDVLGSTKCCKCFRTKQAVRIGDDADEDGGSQFLAGSCHSERSEESVVLDRSTADSPRP